MQVRHAGIVVLALAVACASDASGPIEAARELTGGSATLLSGRVLGVVAGPDSAIVPVRGAEILIYRVDSIPVDTVPVDTIPVDTIPVDTVPSDTMLWSGLTLRPMLLDSGVVDSLPTDTIPTDTIPTDTIPPDTIPPPPPPEPGCGRPGELVARLQSGQEGKFRLAGLPSAQYDLKIMPPRGSRFGRTFYCGVNLVAEHPAELRIFLPPKSGGN